MASNVLIAEDLPTFSGRETLEEKVKVLYDHIFLLRQQLDYLLRNLGEENFNATALRAIKTDMQTAFRRESAIYQTENGTRLGESGKRLDLIGTVYMNGVLVSKEDTDETA